MIKSLQMRSIKLIISILFSVCIFACTDPDNGNADHQNDIENPDNPDNPKDPDIPDIPDGVVYLGLEQELSRAAAEAYVWNKYGVPYRPSMQIIDGSLYVTSVNGIYRKNLETINDTEWELYGFEGIPVRYFVKNGDRLLVTTAIRNEQAFLLSEDDGQTYEPYTSENLMTLASGHNHDVICLGLNNDPEYLLSLIDGFGVYYSRDFGKTWTETHNALGGFQDWFVGRNPFDGSIIYHTGEFEFFKGFVYASFDSGKTWEMVVGIDNNCIHCIAFHQSLSNVVYFGGEGIIGKSVDFGRTWEQAFIDYVYFLKIVPDPKRDGVLYGLGVQRNDEQSLEIYFSTDGGDSWQIFHKKEYEDSVAVLDALIYDDKLFMYSTEEGVLAIELEF